MEFLLPSVSKKMTRNHSLDLISNSLREIQRSLPNTIWSIYQGPIVAERNFISLYFES